MSKAHKPGTIASAPADLVETKEGAKNEARDLELINRAADELNTEVEDVLRYQNAED
ncbi:MAG TPA: hypothetical protein VF753_21380 [Terriglobales bacterium]